MIVFTVGIITFLAVEGLLVYVLWKYRAGRGHEPEQIHGNTKMEIGWTAGATIILVVLAVVGFLRLGVIRNPPNSVAGIGQSVPQPVVFKDPSTNERLPPNHRAMVITVTGQQYFWSFSYPDRDNDPLNNVYAYGELVVPTGTTVILKITSNDVIHSWWIPKLGGKFDAVPGYNNYTWFQVPPNQAGSVYRGQCAELCGRNHANMLAQVRALSPANYVKWLAEKKLELAQSKAAVTKQRALVNAGLPLS